MNMHKISKDYIGHPDTPLKYVAKLYKYDDDPTFYRWYPVGSKEEDIVRMAMHWKKGGFRWVMYELTD